jgi:hypothetical protein
MMDQLYEQALGDMEAALDRLAKQVPPPQRVPFRDGFVFRYVERTAQQALVQKLARIITGLRAARLLLTHGLVQEQAALQRVLDELQEDASFLAFGVIRSELTDLHQSFLAAFYEEEFDNPESAIDSTQKRPMVSRQKIRAYLARVEGSGDHPSGNVDVSRTISKAYSGFVHAASPQIMDMYGGSPPRFHVRGMLGMPRMREYEEDVWNYFYRGIIEFGFSAKAFGDEELFQSILAQKRHFEQQSGRSY